MYKDKDKQREANAERQRRYRANRGFKAYPKGVTTKGVTPEKVLLSEGVTDKALPDGVVWESEPGAAKKIDEIMSGKPKRGKDIKCFADLPLDVQLIIDKMSTTDGKLDKDEKAKRTLAAINYQHLFPERYESTGGAVVGVAGLVIGSPDIRDKTNTMPIVTGKPGDEDYNGVCTDEWRRERGR